MVYSVIDFFIKNNLTYTSENLNQKQEDPWTVLVFLWTVMELLMTMSDMQELEVDPLFVLVSYEGTKKVEEDTWGSQVLEMVGLLVDLVSVMAKETIEEAGDN